MIPGVQPMRQALLNYMKRRPGLYRFGRFVRDRFVRPLQNPLSGRSLARHARAAQTADNSHAHQGEYLRGLLARCGLDAGSIVELAAGDGVYQSAALPLYRTGRWSGVAIELDPVRFARLAYAYRQFPDVQLVRTRATPDSIEALLRGFGVPANFTLFDLDIDSYDLHIAQAVLRTFQPAVFMMEINESVPPPVYFTVRYGVACSHADHFFGCSLTAAAELVLPHGYVLESLQYNTALFVRADVARKAGIVDVPVERAYREGYADRPDRAEWFAWNYDMVHLLDLSPEQVIHALRQRWPNHDEYEIAIRTTGPQQAIASQATTA